MSVKQNLNSSFTSLQLRPTGHLLPSGAPSSFGYHPARFASSSSRWTGKLLILGNSEQARLWRQWTLLRVTRSSMQNGPCAPDPGIHFQQTVFITKVNSIILLLVIYLQYQTNSLKITETECKFIAVSNANC